MNEMDDFYYMMRRVDMMTGEFRRVKTWLKVLSLIVVLSVLIGCDMASPTGPSSSLPSVDQMDAWPEAEERILNWLYTHKECRSTYKMPRVRLLDAKPTLAGAACEYDPNERIIRAPGQYQTTAWGAGCIAHELGHAALHQAGNDCWRPYEHDGVAPKRPSE